MNRTGDSRVERFFYLEEGIQRDAIGLAFVLMYFFEVLVLVDFLEKEGYVIYSISGLRGAVQKPASGVGAAMDHLRAIDDAAGPPDEVHFMGTDSSQYDGSRTTAFPCCLSFIPRDSLIQNARKVDTLELKKPPCSPVQKIPFLQSWLLFGVLESFALLRISLKSCNFVSVRNDC